MKKYNILTIIAFGALIATNAHADDAKKPDLNFSGQFSASSDGIYRGQTQTEGKPQYVAHIQADYGKIYGLVRYKSMEDSVSGVDYQMNYVFGYKDKFKGFSYNAYAAYKQYENVKPVTVDNEFWEYQIDISKPITPKLKGKLSLAYTADGYGRLKESLYSEIGLDYYLTKNLALIGTTGYRDTSNSVNFSNYMVGLSYNLNKEMNLSLRYNDTNKEKILGKKYSDSTYVMLVRKF